MRKMTSEVIAELQKYVDKYGDLPFALWDNEYRSGYSNVSIDVASTENDGCSAHTIGITFCDEWEAEVKQREDRPTLGAKTNQTMF